MIYQRTDAKARFVQIAGTIIGVVLAMAMLTGCVQVRYGEFSYTRLGSQEIQGLTVETGDTTVTLDSQKSDAAETISAAKELYESVKVRP